MKKVKLFIGQGYSISEDEYSTRIERDIQDWTELSDEEYKNLIIHKFSIESYLKSKGLMEWNQQLLIVRETSDEEVNYIRLNLKEIINSIAEKERAREEKEKKRLQKLQKTAEERKKAKELAQLKKLQEKYGEKSESTK